jgi:hypothetical protein
MRVSIDHHKVELLDGGDRDTIVVSEVSDNNTKGRWGITRADLEAAPRLPWPEAVPLTTVPREKGVDGHHWLSNSTFEQLLAL